MNRLAGWIGLFLLALSTQACVSSGVYEWATEEAPCSEVVAPITVAFDAVTLPAQIVGTLIVVNFLFHDWDHALVGIGKAYLLATCVVSAPGISICTWLALAVTGHGTQAGMSWLGFKQEYAASFSWLRTAP